MVLGSHPGGDSPLCAILTPSDEKSRAFSTNKISNFRFLSQPLGGDPAAGNPESRIVSCKLKLRLQKEHFPHFLYLPHTKSFGDNPPTGNPESRIVSCKLKLHLQKEQFFTFLEFAAEKKFWRKRKRARFFNPTRCALLPSCAGRSQKKQPRSS